VVVAALAALGQGPPEPRPNRPALPEEERTRVEAEATGQAAEADRLFKAGDFAAALPLYEAERASRAALNDVRYEAYATRAVGCCRAELGDFEAAIAAWSDAQALDSRREDRGFEGYDRLLIASAQLRLERPQEAIVALTSALPLLAQGVDRDHEADARLLLARAWREVGQPARARPHLERALELAGDLKDAKRLAGGYAEWGQVALGLGEPGLAAEWLSDAHDVYQEQGMTAEAAALDRLLGDALLDLGQSDAARARVERAARVHGQRNDPTALGDDLEFLSALKLGAGDTPAARDLARKVVAARREADDTIGEVEALITLAHCESLGGDWAAAAETLSSALRLARRDGAPADQVRLLILAADVGRRAGPQGRQRTSAWLDEAQRIAQKAGDPALSQAVTEARRRAP
jgi:tetratricopeptide (TPR) repeat protein